MTVRRVLLDENLPVRLRRWLPGLDVVSAEFMGWKGVRNGDLVRRVRNGGFDVFVTADRPLAMAPRVWIPVGCIFVSSNRAALLKAASADIVSACLAVLPGQVLAVAV